jgi:tRNA (uracil-5-)-methyltransferase
VKRLATMAEDDVSVARHEYEPDRYEELLELKRLAVQADFSTFLSRAEGCGECVEVEAHGTGPSHYRARCKFAVRVDDVDGRLGFCMQDGGKWRRVQRFPVATRRIDDVLAPLLSAVVDSAVLSERLASVALLDTMCAVDPLLITLVYRGEGLLDDAWAAAGEALQRSLGVWLIGRCKGRRRVLVQDWVTERLTLADGRTLVYKQVEGSFSNPNPRGNIATMDFLGSCARQLTDTASGPVALLELYCGNGNHTVALAPLFHRVVAVEISQPLCDAAAANLAANHVANAQVVCVPSERFARQQLRDLRVRGCTSFGLRLEDFGAVLVDPPRDGVDSETLKLLALFPSVLYVSCNADTLLPAMATLHETHAVERFALLDLFPYTKFREVAVHLRRRDGVASTRATAVPVADTAASSVDAVSVAVTAGVTGGAGAGAGGT